MLPEVERLRVQSLWLLKKALPSRGEPDISLSVVNRRHAFILTLYACIISPKCGSVLNTRSNNFIRMYIEHVTLLKRKNHFMSRYEG